MCRFIYFLLISVIPSLYSMEMAKESKKIKDKGISSDVINDDSIPSLKQLALFTIVKKHKDKIDVLPAELADAAKSIIKTDHAFALFKIFGMSYGYFIAKEKFNYELLGPEPIDGSIKLAHDKKYLFISRDHKTFIYKLDSDGPELLNMLPAYAVSLSFDGKILIAIFPAVMGEGRTETFHFPLLKTIAQVNKSYSFRNDIALADQNGLCEVITDALVRISYHGDLNCINFLAFDPQVYIFNTHCGARLKDTHLGLFKHRFTRMPYPYLDEGRPIAYAKNRNCVLAACPVIDSVTFFDLSKQEAIGLFSVAEPGAYDSAYARCVDITPDARYGISGHGNGAVRFYDLTEPKKVKTLLLKSPNAHQPIEDESKGIFSVAIHPSGKLALSSLEGVLVTLHDTTNGETVILNNEGLVYHIGFSPEGGSIFILKKDKFWVYRFDWFAPGLSAQELFYLNDLCKISDLDEYAKSGADKEKLKAFLQGIQDDATRNAIIAYLRTKLKNGKAALLDMCMN